MKIINTYSYSIDFINTYDLQYDLIRYVRRNTARILLYGSPNILDSIRKKFILKYESPDYTMRTKGLRTCFREPAIVHELYIN
jgi:hypothetical protein